MINNKIDAQVATEVASHEGLVREAYKDSKGIWTWSIGLTSASGHSVERYIGKPQELRHCLAVYAWALERYADDVRKAFTKPLTQAQFAAALSFNYNTGAIGRASWVKKFNAGDIAGAKKAFMEWRKPPEIISRREKERDLFFDGKWSNNGTILEYQNVTGNGKPTNPKRTEIKSTFETIFKPQVVTPVEIKPTAPAQPTNAIGKLVALFVTVGGAIGAAVLKYFGII